MNILFLAPKTFGYDEKIKRALEELGYNVIFFQDTYFSSKLIKILLRIFPNLMEPFLGYLLINEIKKFPRNYFSKILVIRGEGVSQGALEVLSERFFGAKKVLYLWDNIKNVRHVKRKLRWFDEIYSYDPQDCNEYEFINFRPLFFSNESVLNESKSFEEKDSIFFVGTLHSDRAKIVIELMESVGAAITVDYYFFARTRFEYFVKAIFDKHVRRLDRKRIILKAMAYDEMISKMQASKYVFDTQHPNNTGLTMRTFEAIASRTKLITVNEDIRQYEFYDSNVICVVSRKNLSVPCDFFSNNDFKIHESFFKNYSISAFIADILR